MPIDIVFNLRSDIYKGFMVGDMVNWTYTKTRFLGGGSWLVRGRIELCLGHFG